MPSDAQLIDTLLDVCHRLHRSGMVAANDGNVSVLCDDGNYLTSVTGVSKGEMTARHIVKVNRSGEPLEEGKKPSSELRMHLAIYLDRPDVRAVVHAHPLYATGFAAAGLALDRCVLPEIVMTLGSIPLADYGTPSTEEVPEAVAKWIGAADAVLLSNHGAVTVGPDLMEAFYKMERIEHYAHICFIARQLGGERLLTPVEVEKIYQLREDSGMTNRNPGCWTCDAEIPGSCVGDACVNYPSGRDNFAVEVRKKVRAILGNGKHINPS
ncbi:class II aldolase/adducin family protein [bacterium]|nr:class II aldolase/adducin family protein [bacterium]MBU1651098.1 class II aldolase/adducin family protein [bacterium]